MEVYTFFRITLSTFIVTFLLDIPEVSYELWEEYDWFKELNQKLGDLSSTASCYDFAELDCMSIWDQFPFSSEEILESGATSFDSTTVVSTAELDTNRAVENQGKSRKIVKSKSVPALSQCIVLKTTSNCKSVLDVKDTEARLSTPILERVAAVNDLTSFVDCDDISSDQPIEEVPNKPKKSFWKRVKSFFSASTARQAIRGLALRF